LRLCLTAVLALLVPVASASGETPAPAGQAGVSSGGGLNMPGVPRITNLSCLTGCTQIRTGSAGGTVEISGSDLESVEAAAFRTARGRNRVKPDSVSASRVTVTVPDDAVTGKLVVIGFGGARSKPSAATLKIGPAPRPQGRIRVTDASVSPVKAFQLGTRRPTLRFILAGGRTRADLRIDVIDRRDRTVQSLFRSDIRIGSPQAVTWGGKTSQRKSAPNGAYRFVIRTGDGAEAAMAPRLARKAHKSGRSAKTKDPFGFRMYRFIFPVRGAHQYWGGIGNGRGHQGIDIGARCGKPIRAARAGTVYWNGYDAGGAGNYLVINTTANHGKSQVYMHMPARSKYRAGAKVKTGQVIGRVGSTGRSSGCHLHFEEWSRPGRGGTFLNPLRQLKQWDRYS